MKTTIKIDDISEKELAILFDCSIDFAVRLSCYARNKGGFYTDTNISTIEKAARSLVEGYSIHVVDFNGGEEDVYGHLLHRFNKAWGMVYSLSLYQLKENLGKAMSEHPSLWGYIQDWIFNEGTNLDANGASIILQYIVFGELIYG